MITREFFIEILGHFSSENWIDLHRQFTEAPEKREQSDWTWYLFVQSYATNGGVKRWDGFVQSGRSEEIRWGRIEQESGGRLDVSLEYLNALSPQFLDPWRRFGTQPALLSTLTRFWNAGGPANIALEWESKRDKADLLNYLKSYHYIGNKYSRNMCMDVADPLVLDSFAFDHRLNNILNHVSGFAEQRTYLRKERWLKEILTEIQNRNHNLRNMRCWHLDRLLFQQYDLIYQLVKNEPESTSAKKHNKAKRRKKYCH